MFSFDHFDVDIISVVSITGSTDMHHYFADGDTLITFIWVMVVSRPPMILTFQIRTLLLGPTSRLVGTQVISINGLTLVYFSVHYDFLLSFVDSGVEVGVDYTDYYTYLRRKGFAGRFGTGVYLYVY